MDAKTRGEGGRRGEGWGQGWGYRGGGDGRIEVGYFQGCSAGGSSSEGEVGESCLQNNGMRRLYSGRCYCLKKEYFLDELFPFLRGEGALVPKKTDREDRSSEKAA